MNTWFRKVGMGALALTLAGVLGGCNNGNGSGLIRLYFGINGSGSCNSVTVEVNLDDAGAIIARDEEGDLQCELNSALAESGCDIAYQELENGDLRVTIDECVIPAVTNLFSCLFEQVDISELQETASSICACRNEGCDGTPPVCISDKSPDPTICEDCDNGKDDDGNGLIDCEDPNCENAPECGATTTTTSTSTSVTVSSTSTTVSTTTSTSVTTSTTLNFPFTCRLVFNMPDDVTASSLQYDTDYSNAPGFILGQGGNVECAGLVTDSLNAFNDIDDEELLDSGIVNLDGFTGPIDVAECTFKASTIPVKDDFVITVTEASKPDLTLIAPLPDVIIRTIDCDGEPTTTTTLDGVTTTTVDVTTTTIVNPVQNYQVQYILSSSSAGVGSLQWGTDYTNAPGEFSGSGAGVNCSNQVTGGFFVPNDDDANRKLTLGVIALSPFSAVSTLAHCTFVGDPSDPPVPADFPVTVEDATDVPGDPVSVGITVAVIEIP